MQRPSPRSSLLEPPTLGPAWHILAILKRAILAAAITTAVACEDDSTGDSSSAAAGAAGTGGNAASAGTGGSAEAAGASGSSENGDFVACLAAQKGRSDQRCRDVGETCTCSGIPCGAFHDETCTVSCSSDHTWSVHDCTGHATGAGGTANGGAAGADAGGQAGSAG